MSSIYTATKIAIVDAIISFRGPGLDAFALADLILWHLRTAFPRSRERRLELPQLIQITSAHVGELQALSHGQYLYRRASAGAVSNSYRSSAYTDWVEIFSARDASGQWYTEIRAARNWADKVPWGRGFQHTSQAGPLDSKKGGSVSATCRSLVPMGPANDDVCKAV